MQGARLDDARLFEPVVGATPALSCIRSLVELLEQEPAPHGSGALLHRRVRAAEILAEIARSVPDTNDPIAPELVPGSELHRRLFTEACLLWPRYGESGGRIVVDTLRARSLRRFPIDFDPDDARGRGILIDALQDAFAWSRDELGRLDRQVGHVASNLKVKQAIAHATAGVFREMVSGCPGVPAIREKEAALMLMTRLYGRLPFRAGDIDLVVTNSGVFFCVPHQGTTLLREGFEDRSEGERRAVERFLRHLDEQNTAQTDRFPSFGFFDRSAVDPDLIEELTRRLRADRELADIRPEVVAETLATMVQLLPTQLADQYLIHDDWGHGWQEELSEFEWLYSKLKRLDDPVRPETGPFFGGEGVSPLRDAFASSEGVVRLDEANLLQTVERDLRGRISVSLNFILSEMLADLVEHKVVRRRRPDEEHLPSSSLFPERPLKLDLTWFDVSGQAKLLWSAYDRLARDQNERLRLARDLERSGIEGSHLDEAVERAASLVAERFGHVPSTLVDRVMLHAIALERDLERFLRIGDERYERMGSAAGRDRWRCPWACIDLLVLVLAHFYEDNRAINYWRLPALLREGLPISMERLEDAIARRAAGSPA